MSVLCTETKTLQQRLIIHRPNWIDGFGRITSPEKEALFFRETSSSCHQGGFMTDVSGGRCDWSFQKNPNSVNVPVLRNAAPLSRRKGDLDFLRRVF